MSLTFTFSFNLIIVRLATKISAWQRYKTPNPWTCNLYTYTIETIIMDCIFAFKETQTNKLQKERIYDLNLWHFRTTIRSLLLIKNSLCTRFESSLCWSLLIKRTCSILTAINSLCKIIANLVACSIHKDAEYSDALNSKEKLFTYCLERFNYSQTICTGLFLY